MNGANGLRTKSIEKQRGRDQVSELEEKERIAYAEKVFHSSRASSLRVLSAKTGISYVSYYRIIIQKLKT